MEQENQQELHFSGEVQEQPMGEAMQPENTEVSTKNQSVNPLAMQQEVKRGLEEPIQREDLIIPRASLLQSKSPEVEDPIFAHLGLKSGQIINSLTKDELPSEFIPIIRFVNWIRFNPRDRKHENFDPAYEPGQMLWLSNDPHDPRVVEEGVFGPNGEKPLATKFINFISLFPGVRMPVIVSFSKTSFKTGKELTSLVKFTPGDVFSRKYKLISKEAVTDGNRYNVFAVQQLGAENCLPTIEEYNIAEKWYNDLSPKIKDVHVHEQEKSEKEEWDS